MSPSTAHSSIHDTARFSTRSAVFGYWRSYYFGFYFADEGAPGD